MSNEKVTLVPLLAGQVSSLQQPSTVTCDGTKSCVVPAVRWYEYPPLPQYKLKSTVYEYSKTPKLSLTALLTRRNTTLGIATRGSIFSPHVLVERLWRQSKCSAHQRSHNEDLQRHLSSKRYQSGEEKRSVKPEPKWTRPEWKIDRSLRQINYWFANLICNTWSARADRATLAVPWLRPQVHLHKNPAIARNTAAQHCGMRKHAWCLYQWI